MNLFLLQRTIFSKIAAMLLLLGLFLPSASPLSAQTRNGTVEDFLSKKTPLEEVIDIPRSIVGTTTASDLSQVDWEQTIQIDGKKVKLSSKNALKSLDIDPKILRLVEMYRGDIDAINGTIFMLPSTRADKRKHITEALQYGIAEVLIEKGQLPEDYFELKLRGIIEPGNHAIDISKNEIKQLDPEKVIEVDSNPRAVITDVRTKDPNATGETSALETAWNTVTRVVTSAYNAVAGFIGDVFSSEEGSQAESTTTTRFVWDRGVPEGTKYRLEVSGDEIKYSDPDGHISFTPSSISWDGQQVKSAQNVTSAKLSQNEYKYDNVLGAGISVDVKGEENTVRKHVQIDSLASLGSIPQSAEYLEIAFHVDTDYEVPQGKHTGKYDLGKYSKMLTPEVWDSYIPNPKELRDTNGDIEQDLRRNRADIQWEFKKEDNGYTFIKYVPVEWLKSAQYPIYTDVDISYGSQYEFDTGFLEGVRVLPLDTDKFAVCWTDGSDATAEGKCVVGTVSGSTISYGSPSQFASDITAYSGYQMSACRATTNKIAVVYADDTSTDEGYIRFATVSGTTIGTWGTAQQLASTNDLEDFDCVDINTDKVAIIYNNEGTSDEANSIVCTASGTTATCGSEDDWSSTDYFPAYTSIARADTDKFIGCTAGIDTGTSVCVVGSVSGTTITHGTVSTVDNTATNVPYVSVAALATDNVVIGIGDGFGTEEGWGYAATISGTTLTKGNRADLTLDANVNIAFIGHDSTHFLGVWADDIASSLRGISNYSSVNFGTRTITPGTSETLDASGVSTSDYGLDITYLGNDKFVACFSDVDDSSDGKCIVGDKQTISNSAPTAPSSLLAEGQTNPTDISDPTPEFSVIYNDSDTSDVALSYQIQVATSSTFTSTYWNSGKTSLASSTPKGSRIADVSYGGSTLASSTTYYWRIKFWDTADAEGAWSTATSTFSLEAPIGDVAPTAPSSMKTEGLTNPTDIDDTTPEFSAIYNDPNTGDLANKYRLQVSTGSTFSSVYWDSGTTTMATTTAGSRSPVITYAGSTLATSTTYYWRIRFIDDESLVGAWSTATSTFVIGTGVSGNSTTTQAAFDFLIDVQNEDGSWGNATSTFLSTAAAVDALYTYGETGASYESGIAWLSTYFAENNDYLAQKIELLMQADEATSTAEILVSALDESTGGFRFKEGYQSDPATTARTLQALTAAGYQDSGTNPDLTTSLASYNLTQTQRFDERWAAFDGGVSSIAITAEAIEALLPYKHQSLSGFETEDVDIDDTLEPALSSLTSTQMSNGTWGNNLLDTAFAFTAVKVAGNIPTFGPQTVSYFQGQQEVDGSFANGDIYTTAKVLKALAIPTPELGNLVVDDIAPLTALQTSSSTSIRIDITNNGAGTVDSGILHVVADGYVIGSFDFGDHSIVVNPSETEEITLSIPNTSGFVGDVVFTAFVEGAGNVIHADSRYQETLTFAEAAGDLPGLPMYFYAHKWVFDGQPAIEVRWHKKDDPNRANYIFLWREAGATTTWSYYPVGDELNGGFVYGAFAEDTLYEVTMGSVTLDEMSYVVHFDDPVEVKTSSDEEEYADGSLTGSMLSAKGLVPNLDMVGGGDFSTTNEDGEISLNNVTWGTHWTAASNYRYEEYVTLFATEDTPVVGHKAYTNLRPDTEDPTVTYLAIFNESDYEMGNKEMEIINIGVDDDIGISTGIVESATFYYYDPHDEEWHFIGTKDGPLFSTQNYNWYIPDTLLGEGYKIGAIARDFAGKESARAEWGPFEITEGNADPEFTFIAPSISSSNEAETSYTIQWTDKDDEDDANIYLFYDPDALVNNGNSVSIATVSEDDFLNQYEWNTSAIGAGTYYVRAIVEDGVNSNLIVTAGQTVTISHNSPTAPSALLAEGQTNPTNIGDATPEFSAIFNDPNASSTATHYQIQVATTSAFTSTHWNSAKTALASTTTNGSRIADVSYSGTALASSTTYYWRIKFWDNSANEGDWSTTTSSFSLALISNTAPIAPTLLQAESQTNPTNITDATPEFWAIYVDPGATSTATHYQIQVSTSSAFTSTYWDSSQTSLASSTPPGMRIADISYAGSALASSTTYYWRIKLWDDGGLAGSYSTTTSTFTLAAGNSAPIAPTALQAEGATNPTGVSDPTPELSALYIDPNASDSANFYQIQVATSSAFTSAYWDSGKTGMATTSQGSRSPNISYAGSALASSTTYYWRIKFWDISNTEGSYSTTTSTFSLASGAATSTLFKVASTIETSSNWSTFSTSTLAASDNSYSVASLGFDPVGQISDFNFGIPSGATINGVEVKVEGKTTSFSSGLPISLSWNDGTSYTSTKSNTITTTESVFTYGSSSDTWGHSWSDTEFADGTFRLKVDPPSTNWNMNIDHIQVKVYYTN